MLIALGVAVVFIVLGVAVPRDARRHLTDDDRAALERESAGGPSAAVRSNKQRDAARAKARQKAKAARTARKRTTRNR